MTDNLESPYMSKSEAEALLVGKSEDERRQILATLPLHHETRRRLSRQYEIDVRPRRGSPRRGKTQELRETLDALPQDEKEAYIYSAHAPSTLRTRLLREYGFTPKPPGLPKRGEIQRLHNALDALPQDERAAFVNTTPMPPTTRYRLRRDYDLPGKRGKKPNPKT